jgi:hypothetical protein
MRLVNQRVDSIPGEQGNCHVGDIAEGQFIISVTSESARYATGRTVYFGTYSWVFFSSSLRTCLSEEKRRHQLIHSLPEDPAKYIYLGCQIYMEDVSQLGKE